MAEKELMANGRRQRKPKDSKRNNGAILGFEEKLWQAADKLRGYNVTQLNVSSHTTTVSTELRSRGNNVREIDRRQLLIFLNSVLVGMFGKFPHLSVRY